MKQSKLNSVQIFSVLIVLTVWINKVNGQDKIVQLSKDTIICKVREINDENVKFSYEDEDLINNLSKNVIKEIIFLPKPIV